MGTRERRADRGTAIARRVLVTAGRELREARTAAGLSLRVVGQSAGCSASAVSRIERAMVRGVSVVMLARLAAVVGLDLSARMYPAGPPIRDRAHLDLLRAFRSRLHASIRWATEVPLPIPGDPRRWDALVRGADWRAAVEAETAPNDWQALSGRLHLKQRDGRIEQLILVLPETRRTRQFLAAAGGLLGDQFPVPPRQLLARLAAGDDPGGSGIVVVTVHPARPTTLAPPLAAT